MQCGYILPFTDGELVTQRGTCGGCKSLATKPKNDAIRSDPDRSEREKSHRAWQDKRDDGDSLGSRLHARASIPLSYSCSPTLRNLARLRSSGSRSSSTISHRMVQLMPSPHSLLDALVDLLHPTFRRHLNALPFEGGRHVEL